MNTIVRIASKEGIHLYVGLSHKLNEYTKCLCAYIKHVGTCGDLIIKMHLDENEQDKVGIPIYFFFFFLLLEPY